jgi:hypothetical protein
LLLNFSISATVIANNGNDLIPSLVGAARRLRIVATRHGSPLDRASAAWL